MPRPVAVKAQPSAATALLNQAVARHQAGRLDEAATLYAQVLGLDELVAATPAGFADIAMRLVEDARWRAHLGREIAQRRHALFFDQAPVRALEAALFEAAGVARPG